jgi:hypothetical protein
MGQQQLLLIILGVIIVGIAVAVGITMFQDNALDQSKNMVIADLQMLGAKAQQFYVKPVTLGGGGNTFNGLDSLGVIASAGITDNPNGKYTLPTKSATSITIHGKGKTADASGTFPSYNLVVTGNSVTLGAMVVEP